MRNTSSSRNTINGESLTNYYRMFDSLSSATVKGVASENTNVTDMSYNVLPIAKHITGCQPSGHFERDQHERYVFRQSATALDVSSFDTSNVTNMNSMFRYSRATALDLQQLRHMERDRCGLHIRYGCQPEPAMRATRRMQQSLTAVTTAQAV